jgi:predicted RNA-binding Zn-ribbon protein involved in translation (DUF1610 family)
MPMIFNEYEYAESLLAKGFKDIIKWSDLIILSKYYRFKGYKKSQIKKNIVEFYKKYYPDYNEVIMGEKIDNAIRKSEKQSLHIDIDVYITENEIKNIRSIKHYKYEKILFVMLVIARRNKILYKSTSPRYYTNQRFSNILQIAKVYVNKNERNKIKHDLHKLGMITAPEMNRMSEYNKNEMQELLYADENSEHIVIVNDFNNIVSFYPQICTNCGKTITPKNKKKIDLCDDCYSEKRAETKRKSAKERYYQSL